MSHRGGWRCPVPVLESWWKPNHIARLQSAISSRPTAEAATITTEAAYSKWLQTVNAPVWPKLIP